jgi:hypothetical protein
MALGEGTELRRNLGYIGVHGALLAGAVGLLFLQRYIWLAEIAVRGWGPYQTVSDIALLSAVMIAVDLVVIRVALRGTRTERSLALLWPAFFFGTAAFILVANNL